MPPKKNMKKSKPKRKANAKPAQFRLGSDERPVISKPKPSPTSTTNVDNRKISNKPQTQSVNVNVSVGGKSTESKTREPRETRESSSSKKSTEQFRSFAPTIIPQYVYGNPPQPPNRVVQPIYNPIRPNPIMTSQQSLDQTTSLTIPSVVGRMTTASTLDDDISSLSDFSSRAVVSQPNYAVSGLTDELRSESYKYSEPSGINLQSINSSEADMSMPIPRTNFTNRPFDTTQSDSYDDVAALVRASVQKSLQERISRPRPPLKEIIYDDGSIQVLSEEQEPITLEMSKSDEPALSGIVDEEFKKLSMAERVKLVDEQIKNKRGRKTGGKNRPKEEIEAERQEKLLKKKVKESQKLQEEQRRREGSDWIANRYDEIEQRVAERERLREKIEDL